MASKLDAATLVTKSVTLMPRYLGRLGAAKASSSVNVNTTPSTSMRSERKVAVLKVASR
jgi:hypothetical protein